MRQLNAFIHLFSFSWQVLTGNFEQFIGCLEYADHEIVLLYYIIVGVIAFVLITALTGVVIYSCHAAWKFHANSLKSDNFGFANSNGNEWQYSMEIQSNMIVNSTEMGIIHNQS